MTRVPDPTVPDGSRRRILFVTHTSEWIGPNISLLELVTRLPDKLSPLVAVPGTGRFNEALEENGISVRFLKRIDKYGIPALVRMIRLEEVSLVYGNSAHGASRNALIAAKMCGRPFVYHLREMCGQARMRTVMFLRLADAVVAVSRATAESYTRFLQQPATVVYNGVPEEHFAHPLLETRQRLRREFGIPAHAPVVVHVGNVYRRKAQHLAVRAFQDLKHRQPDARLFLVGRLDRDPEYVRELEDKINEVNQSRHIHLTGFRPDVRDFLAASDVLVHTATEDPHPRAVIEAMAAGLPVVAVAVDGVKESILDGECGFLVEPPGDPERLAERLDRILGSPELKVHMGAKGRNRALRLFSAERTAEEISYLIEQALQTSGR